MSKPKNSFPPGSNEERVGAVLRHYEGQSEDPSPSGTPFSQPPPHFPGRAAEGNSR